MPGRGPVYGHLSPAKRLCALFAAAPVVAIGTLGVVALVSSLYSSLGFELLRRPGGLDGGLSAVRRAATLAPWRSEPYAYLASAHLLRNDPAGAALAIDARLRWAPADGQAWLQRSTLLRRTGRFDSGLVASYELALARAPHSPTLHYLIALDGLYDWDNGDAALRSIWLANTERVLRWNQRPFLYQVTRRGREAVFCSYAGPRITKVRQWCTALDRLRTACAVADLNDAQASWCREMGLAPGDGHAD